MHERRPRVDRHDRQDRRGIPQTLGLSVSQGLTRPTMTTTDWRMTRMARASTQEYAWRFYSRVRRHAFGWRGSRSAIQRIDEPVAELKAVGRTDRNLAAEGALCSLKECRLRSSRSIGAVGAPQKSRTAHGEQGRVLRAGVSIGEKSFMARVVMAESLYEFSRVLLLLPATPSRSSSRARFLDSRLPWTGGPSRTEWFDDRRDSAWHDRPQLTWRYHASA
jgi:hypothetical protein